MNTSDTTTKPASFKNPEKYWSVDEIVAMAQPLKAGYKPSRNAVWRVLSDGIWREVKTMRSLQKWLDCTYAKKPEVYVNALGEITIYFA